MRKLLLAILVAALGTTATAVADPNLPNVTPHRHFMETEKGRLVQVGPRVCDNPNLQDAFNQFHSNVHVPVADSPGPEHAAPGVHNDRGTEVTAVRGCAPVAR